MLNVKKIRPRYTQVITTAEKYENSQTLSGSSILDTKKMAGTLKEYQKVVAIGPMVKDINIGDIVMIDPTRYGRMKHREGSLKDGVITDNPIISYNIPTVEIDNETYLKLQDNDIEYVILEFEEVDDYINDARIIVPKQEIIV